MELTDATIELDRRIDILAARNQREAGQDMPPVEARVHFRDLARREDLADAERIAQMGRKANVGLVVEVPTVTPFLEHFGGSQLLADMARQGRTVRTEAVR
jgi:hypothetical protein